jgi:hypothetical protein
MPSSAKEFREFAQECLRWAGETKSERHRQVLLEMARTWTQAALEAERGLGLIYEAPLRSSKPSVFGFEPCGRFRPVVRGTSWSLLLYHL